jgi:hypothetical protein
MEVGDNLNTADHNDIAKPIHPSALIPRDWDFGIVLETAQGAVPGKDSRTFLRYYDRAIRDWLQQTTIMNGYKIPVVKATPRKAFAEYDRLLKSQANFQASGETTLNDLKRTPLPLISIHRSKLTLRSWGKSVFPNRNLAFSNGAHDGGSNMRRATVYSRRPTPISIPYSIDIWTTYEAQHAWVIQQLLTSLWNNYAYWVTSDPYSGENTFQVPIKVEGISDNGELPDNDSDANHRWTIDIIVEGWMFHDLLLAPTVQTGTTIADVDGEQIIRSELLTTLAPVPLSQQDYTDDIPSSPVDA